MTFSRNPSEHERMTQDKSASELASRNEQYRRLAETKNRLFNSYQSKSAKEADLREVRRLERELGIDGENYNGGTSLEV